ncbi:MAG TPA: YjgN family protein [Gallionellaceae bacterium]
MEQQEQRLSFTGSGSEYFRIWIVNLFLTIITLGIYSAWAKVRRLQYFHRNTILNDSSFDYHADPKAILKGRIIAVGMLLTYNVTIKTMPMVGLGIGLVIALVMPWLLVKSLRFRLYNTSYRGLRFGFDGSTAGGYVNFLLLPILSAVTVFLLAPFAHQRTKAFQHGNSRFGQTNFGFDASAGAFYKVYILGLLLLLLVGGTLGYAGYTVFKDFAALQPKAQHGMAFFTFILAFYAAFIFVGLLVVPYFMSRLQNLVWNGTTLGAHRFSSTLSARGLLWIIVTNFIGIILTFGLFKPFADVRLARYRIEHMSLLAEGDMESFIAGEQQQETATGTETAEMFDVDFSF